MVLHVAASRLLVAVVDDEESVRTALQRLLRSAGLGVATFASGAEFLESLKSDSSRPDCVVLDLHMPQINGFAVLARLATLQNSVPVVAITGHDTPETRQRALAGGAKAYLRKPVDDKALLGAIQVAAGGSQASR